MQNSRIRKKVAPALVPKASFDILESVHCCRRVGKDDELRILMD